MRTTRVIAVAFVATVLCPVTSAMGATVEIDGQTLRYRAAPGETNEVSLDEGADSVVIEDARADVTAVAGCVRHSRHAVECGYPTARSTTVGLSLGDGSDTARVEALVATNVNVSAGAGDDTVHVGSASGVSVRVNAGDGDDRVTTAVNGTGDQVLYGGRGNDRLWIVEGGTGELLGGTGHDRLRMSLAPPRRIDGGAGNDTIAFGVPGAPVDDLSFALDAIVPGSGTDTVSLADLAVGVVLDLARCGGCAENVIGSPYDDVIEGDGQANVLSGGDGADIIEGRSGADHLSGQGGDDTLRARDGRPDDVECGDGEDEASADRGATDLVDTSCERIDRSR